MTPTTTTTVIGLAFAAALVAMYVHTGCSEFMDGGGQSKPHTGRRARAMKNWRGKVDFDGVQRVRGDASDDECKAFPLESLEGLNERHAAIYARNTMAQLSRGLYDTQFTNKVAVAALENWSGRIAYATAGSIPRNKMAHFATRGTKKGCIYLHAPAFASDTNNFAKINRELLRELARAAARGGEQSFETAHTWLKSYASQLKILLL